MQRTFKTRLRVNNKTEPLLRQWAGVSRLAYNVCLDMWDTEYRNGGKPNRYGIRKRFNSIKGEKYPFVTEVSKWVYDYATRDLERAFRNFFAGRAGHPRFHKRGVNDSFTVNGGVVKIDGKWLTLPKGLRLRMCESFRYRDSATKICEATVTRRADMWLVSISCEVPDSTGESQADGVVGIDMGIKSLATCSDGLVIPNPRTLIDRERRKRHLQRALSRKQRGSRNREKAKRRLARYEYHTACKRLDWIHKATRTIADRNRVCFVEGLNVSGMLKNHRLARRLLDCGFRMFRSILSYKTDVRCIDRWYPSSQLCSNCGQRRPMPLSERVYRCDSCGLVMDRDMNAALNILNVGMANYPELMPVEGGTSRTPSSVAAQGRSMKQESTIRPTRKSRSEQEWKGRMNDEGCVRWSERRYP